ncbi:hypothetical protein KUTeg_006177, partial [Tegillarca granosa]
MRENLNINGLREEEGKNLKEKFNKFIVTKLGITNEQIIIDRIHRFGKRNKNYPQPIVAKFNEYNQKERILEKSKLNKTKIKPSFHDTQEISFAHRGLITKQQLETQLLP